MTKLKERFYEIHTEETVHGVYRTKAVSEDDARAQFNHGDLTFPAVYEATDVTIIRVEENS